MIPCCWRSLNEIWGDGTGLIPDRLEPLGMAVYDENPETEFWGGRQHGAGKSLKAMAERLLYS